MAVITRVLSAASLAFLAKHVGDIQDVQATNSELADTLEIPLGSVTSMVNYSKSDKTAELLSSPTTGFKVRVTSKGHQAWQVRGVKEDVQKFLTDLDSVQTLRRRHR